jgi:hypothetical protein
MSPLGRTPCWIELLNEIEPLLHRVLVHLNQLETIFVEQLHIFGGNRDDRLIDCECDCVVAGRVFGCAPVGFRFPFHAVDQVNTASSRWLAVRSHWIWSRLNARDVVLFVPEVGKSEISRLSKAIQAAQRPMFRQGMPRGE